MPAKLLVANLNYVTTDEQLARLFAHHGSVRGARVTTDPHSGRSEGNGVVEMGSDAEAAAAIAALDGREFQGRTLFVDWATRRNETDATHSSLFGPMNMTADPPTHGSHGFNPR